MQRMATLHVTVTCSNAAVHLLSPLALDDCRAWQAEANAPPIIPTRSLYLALYDQGFTVTFITGRCAVIDNPDSLVHHERDAS